MSTALISDLHLASLGGEDLLRERRWRARLWAELDGCTRLVLLGDAFELRHLPLGEALDAARPFLEELGEVMDGGEVLLVPGNHDHRLAEPVLDEVGVRRGGRLGLEQKADAVSPPLRRIDELLGRTGLTVAYPGVWLRSDVYATHGHYMDCHLTLPRAESVAANVLMRLAGRPPDPAEPTDYERALRPLYGLLDGLAQGGAPMARSASRFSEEAWQFMRSSSGGPGPRASRWLARAAIPASVWTLNRALGSSFAPDLSPAAITNSAIAAAKEAVRRLRIDASHVICGHTHRAGPRSEEEPWELAGGGQLHNTGTWVFTSALHRSSAAPNPYWPGTVTRLDADGPPRRIGLLEDIGHDELRAGVPRRA